MAELRQLLQRANAPHTSLARGIRGRPSPKKLPRQTGEESLPNAAPNEPYAVLALAFDSAQRQALDDPALEEEKHEDWG